MVLRRNRVAKSSTASEVSVARRDCRTERRGGGALASLLCTAPAFGVGTTDSERQKRGTRLRRKDHGGRQPEVGAMPGRSGRRTLLVRPVEGRVASRLRRLSRRGRPRARTSLSADRRSKGRGPDKRFAAVELTRVLPHPGGQRRQPGPQPRTGVASGPRLYARRGQSRE